MQRTPWISALVVLCLALAVYGQAPKNDPNVASTPPRTPAEERQGFRLPPGFEIQLVASEPQIAKPMNMAFDNRGRLWVTDTVEYPFPAPPDRKGRDCVKILEDTDGDGKADKVTTFADGLNIPIGLIPVPKGVIVFSIPNIYLLLDTDGDDRCDKREVLLGVYGYKDTHGMTSAFTWGHDGWLYACHGYANESTLTARDGSKITMQSGNTYRFKPDGSHVERYTYGQVNPFGLAFDPLGNLFSADCHTKPLMMLLRGGNYQSFGKPHDGLGFAPEICAHSHDSTAISGVVYYAADQFPKAYRDTVFIGNVVTNRINHDRMARNGSTLTAVLQPDFLTSEDPWFRPVDLKLGPDGAMYVADFYNRIIGHYEVPLTHPGRDRERGRIWRIVYRGNDAKPAVSPYRSGRTPTVAELTKELGHPNLTVRTLAANQLVERGPEVAPQVQKALTGAVPEQRVHVLWVLERLGKLTDEELARAVRDEDASVRVHAQRIFSERATWTPEQRELALAGTKDGDAFVRRAAADALGRHPAAENIRPLLDLLATNSPNDTQLKHTARMALRDQLRQAGPWQTVAALMQPSDARAIADVAPGVPLPEAASYLLTHLARQTEGRDQVRRFVPHIARYGEPEVTKSLLGWIKARTREPREQVRLVQEMNRGLEARGARLDADARSWAAEMAGRLLAAPEPESVLLGIQTAQALRLDSLLPTLVQLLSRANVPENQRAAVVTALTAINVGEATQQLKRILANAAEKPALREQAATALAQMNRPESREILIATLPTAPAALARAIAAGLASGPEGGELLLQAVAGGKASPRLLQDRAVSLRLLTARVPRAQERIEQLTKGLPPTDERIQELLHRQRDRFTAAQPDAAAGAKLFTKHCAICHQVGGQGAKIGPQLDGIGQRGLERILEDVLDPSRNVDQAFRTTALALKNGQLLTGLVLREEGEIVVLADPQGKEVRVEKKQIEERNLSPLSPMPNNVLDQVGEADLVHLLAYLLGQRVSPAKP